MVRMLGKVVEMMSADSSNASHLAILLQELGGRHVKYGVGPLHFSVLETAILRALTKALGGTAEWTEDARKGWAAVLKFIGKAMMAGSGSKKGVGLKIVKDEHAHPVLNNDPHPERCPERGTLRLQVVAPMHRHKNGFGSYPKVGGTSHQHTTDSSGHFHDSFRPSKSGVKYNKLRSGKSQRRTQPARVTQQWDKVIFESCELTSDDDSDHDHVKNGQDDVSMTPSTCDSSVSALSMSAIHASFPDVSMYNAIIDSIERLPDRIEPSRICPSKTGRDAAPRKPWRRHSLKFSPSA